jgi:mRNA degradation ribonuclease J1/J2
MFNKSHFLTILYFLVIPFAAFSQSKNNYSFRIVPLGVLGGIDESNLSAYMVAASGTDNYICLDAGTLHYGIEKAVNNGVFNIPAEQVLRKYIKGYFISHAHLDHIAGPKPFMRWPAVLKLSKKIISPGKAGPISAMREKHRP